MQWKKLLNRLNKNQICEIKCTHLHERLRGAGGIGDRQAEEKRTQCDQKQSGLNGDNTVIFQLHCTSDYPLHSLHAHISAKTKKFSQTSHYFHADQWSL